MEKTPEASTLAIPNNDNSTALVNTQSSLLRKMCVYIYIYTKVEGSKTIDTRSSETLFTREKHRVKARASV